MARDPAGALRWSRMLLRQLSTATAEVREGSLSAAWASGKSAARPKLLYRQISALGRQPKGVVTKTMNKWLREGNTIGSSDVISFVKELRKYKRFDHALELMEWMDSRGMNMSHSNYAIRLDLICKVEGIKSAENYFASFPDPAKNLQTYGCLLNCYCTEKREDEAVVFFEMMKEKDLISSSLPYDNMMSLYMRMGKPEKVALLMEEMLTKKIPPSEFTYTILMNSYAAVNNIDAVETTFKKMENSGRSKPTWTAYTSLASLYISAGNLEKAESALKKAETNIDKGDRQSFHFILTLYARLGKLDDVNRVWATLKSTFPTTLNMSYLSMLQSLSRMDKLDLLEKCFNEWESGCTTYDIRLVNILVGAYLRKDMLEKADELLKKVEEFGCEPDSRTLEMFIDYYIRKDNMGRAREYVEAAIAKAEASGQEWKPNKAKIDAFLQHSEDAGAAGMEEFLERLRKLEVV